MKQKNRFSIRTSNKSKKYSSLDKNVTIMGAGIVSWVVVFGFQLLIGFAMLFVPLDMKIPNPPNQSTVVDQSHYLQKSTVEAIDRANAEWRETPEQLQIGLYITDNLPPMSNLEEFSNQTFRKWQVGYSGTDNGVLIVVAIENRKFRIETSDNASVRITDSEAKRILDNAAPIFRNKNYDQGIRQIVREVGNTFYHNHQADWIVQETKEKSGFWSGIPRGILALIRGIGKYLWYIPVTYVMGWGYLLVRRLYRMIRPTDTMKRKVTVPFMDDDAWFEESSGGGRPGETGIGSSSSSNSSSGWSGGGGDGGGASSDW